MRPSTRRPLVVLCLLSACASAPLDDEVAVVSSELHGVPIAREHIGGDLYHYEFDVRVGEGPNGILGLHRIVRERGPWVPRRSSNAIMMMHGDFARFATNFAPILGDPQTSSPGMAIWLAERGIDVWGLDRRWTQAAAIDADLSDFDAMGIDQELADIGKALRVARAVRLFTDRSVERMILSGFSRGGALAYYYASDEATRPRWKHQVKGLVPLDVYASLSPADGDLRQFYCDSAAIEYGELDAGEVDVPNDFQVQTGRLALEAPDDPNPFAEFDFPFPGATNRDLLLDFVGQTHFYFPATPVYHLNGSVLDENGFATALRDSSVEVVARWLADSPPHQSLRESADTDALLCGDAPLPADVPLSRIEVPLFLLSAAGGYGDRALFSTTEVSSADVTALVVRKLAPENEDEDYGHADLLYAPDAPELAWEPLLQWLRQH